MGFESPSSQLPEEVESEVLGDAKTPENAEAKFSASEKIGDIEMKIGWAEDAGRYEIYFPQIDINDERAKKLGIRDQVIKIGDKDKLAKDVWERAITFASQEADAYETYDRLDAAMGLWSTLESGK